LKHSLWLLPSIALLAMPLLSASAIPAPLTDFPNPTVADLPSVLTTVDADVQHRLLQFKALGTSGTFFQSNDPEVQQIGNAVHFDICAGILVGDTHIPPAAPAITITSFTITDPTGTEFDLIAPNVLIDAFTCHRFEPTDFARDNLHRHSLDLTIPGTYFEHVHCLEAGGGGCGIAADFAISFNVVPETPVGVIALTVASFGSLGAYLKFRR